MAKKGLKLDPATIKEQEDAAYAERIAELGQLALRDDYWATRPESQQLVQQMNQQPTRS